MNTYYPAHREEVNRLLDSCRNAKVLRGGVENAIESAQLAYDFAREHALNPPWPQIAAYRLAQLKLRLDDRAKRLEEIDNLLKEADGEGKTKEPHLLGPLPNLYRLAVLQRRKLQASNSKDQKEFDKTIHDLFEKVTKQVQDFETNSASKEQHSGPLQNGFMNMLEMACYFLNEKYAALEGVGALDIYTSQSWVVIGPDPVWKNVKMAHKFALEEIESISKNKPEAVLFKLGPNDESKWKISGKEWKDHNYDQIKILAWLLAEGQVTRERLRNSIDSENPEAAARQQLCRLQRSIRELTEQPSLQVHKRRSDPLELAEDVKIYGVVHEKTLNSLSRRRH